ncbi:hypothetical protein [Rhizobium alvei]|uniref:Uncharacterized protein n=1 Tax=Rhizobium alvei TaxID=1132659 RepID=A0ABT8YUK3_9HYPH|nr:hypothetical protein [Rhizobium alvei]MDO6967022.1 hypothetical protein [Rhizobium alvei]
MFVLKKEIKAWWPVKVSEPDETIPGHFADYEFEVLFRLLDRDEARAQNDARARLIEGDASVTSLSSANERMRAIEQFDDDSFVGVISDWRGIQDERKAEVPFSEAILRQALKRPHIRKAIFDAYQAMASGEGLRKN